MKSILKNLAVLCLTVSCASGAKSGFRQAGEFSVPTPEQTTLKNGMRILWITDNSLPYVSFQTLLRSGSAQDPKGKEGLANFTADLLDQGTSKRNATQIADGLGQLGADFSASTEHDYIFISSGALSFDKEEILKQYAELILHPIFPNAEIERLRKNFSASMLRLVDSPDQFVESVYPRFLYGQHPYGHSEVGNLKSIRAIKRVDVQNFYRKEFVPSNALMAVVGKYDDKFRSQVIATFEAWQGKSNPVTPLPEFPSWHGTESLLIDRSDLQQAQIQILFKGVPRGVPEFLQLRAGLKILGESFGSRLFDEIRERRGLTYHINAWFDPRMIAGPMGIYTFTRTDKIGETINETLNVYRKFVTDGVTERELADMKALMRGQFPRMFETREAVARQLLILDRYGISIEYLNNYFSNLDKMTTQDVNKVIAKYFDSKNIRIVVYAPKEKALDVLKPLGPVEVKSYKDFLK